MNAWAWLAIHDAVCTVAAVALIITDHPWWAFAFFVLVATATVKSAQKEFS